MKKFIKKMQELAAKGREAITNLMAKANNAVNGLVIRTQSAIANPAGDAQMNTVAGILIAVVCGALILGIVIALYKTTVGTELTKKITDMFSAANS